MREPPGVPIDGGSWQIARRLMQGYEFADPSIVRAFYDPAIPLERRNMLLKLRALGLLHLFVGVRVLSVYEQTRELNDERVRVCQRDRLDRGVRVARGQARGLDLVERPKQGLNARQSRVAR